MAKWLYGNLIEIRLKYNRNTTELQFNDPVKYTDKSDFTG